MKYVIANWKLYLSDEEVIHQATQLVAGHVASSDELEVVVCPPFTSLDRVAELPGRQFTIGAQDCYWEESGAKTGEVAPHDLKSIGCEYVIIGHSERRALGETDEMVNQKIKAAYAAGLNVIMCIGETLDEKNSGTTDERLNAQLNIGLDQVHIPENNKLLVAYEPVWAIYPSKQEVNPEEAITHATAIREQVRHLCSAAADAQISVLYGGSVDSSNVNAFLAGGVFAGALVGHASTNAQEFGSIINSVMNS